jgi:hypothetical protein
MTNYGRAKTEPEDQVMPTVSDRPFIHDLVAKTIADDVAARGELGLRRYGTKLQSFNGRDAGKDAYEELLDAIVYVRQISDELEGYRSLVRALIAADGPCPAPHCGVTVLGHLLAAVAPELVELVKAEDPFQGIVNES